MNNSTIISEILSEAKLPNLDDCRTKKLFIVNIYDLSPSMISIIGGQSSSKLEFLSEKILNGLIKIYFEKSNDSSLKMMSFGIHSKITDPIIIHDPIDISNSCDEKLFSELYTFLREKLFNCILHDIPKRLSESKSRYKLIKKMQVIIEKLSEENCLDNHIKFLLFTDNNFDLQLELTSIIKFRTKEANRDLQSFNHPSLYNESTKAKRKDSKAILFANTFESKTELQRFSKRILSLLGNKNYSSLCVIANDAVDSKSSFARLPQIRSTQLYQTFFENINGHLFELSDYDNNKFEDFISKFVLTHNDESNRDFSTFEKNFNSMKNSNIQVLLF